MVTSRKKGKKTSKGKTDKTRAKTKRAKKPAGKKVALKTARQKEKRVPFKKEMRQKLLEDRKRLLDDVDQKVKKESDAMKFEIGDIYDIATTERQRELTLMLGDREREKLREIDKALERLNEEDYGACEECGEPIGEERLRALPFTRVCVDCKSKSEKETFVKVKVEEEPAIGMLEKAEPEEEF